MEKKILILGGAAVHCKLVEAAHKIGCKVIVVDYLPFEDSPAKMIADESYQIDVFNVPELIDLCKKEKVNGVISTHLDPCQKPYGIICEALELPCLWNRNLINIFTNKQLFKAECIKYGINVTEEYRDAISSVQYPVFVKPVDSRGSRGQLKASNYSELKRAISIAENESSSRRYIIEKYYASLPEIQVAYYFVNGRGYLIRTTDSHRGTGSLENVITSGSSPSVFNKDFEDEENDKIKQFLANIGIRNGPVMLQGFFDNNKLFLFDQGLRFPGVDYEIAYEKVFGINLMEPLVEFAFTGIMPDIQIDEKSACLKDNKFRTLFPLLRPGKIKKIEGIEKVKEIEEVSSILLRKKPGDEIKDVNSIDRRLAEIDVLSGNDGRNQIIEDKIFDLLNVLDEKGNNMLIGW